MGMLKQKLRSCKLKEKFKSTDDCKRPIPVSPTSTNGSFEEKPAIMQTLGLPLSFQSSKGLKHEDIGGVKVKSRRHGRQYMNRRGGFNRPLPAEKTGIKLNDF